MTEIKEETLNMLVDALEEIAANLLGTGRRPVDVAYTTLQAYKRTLETHD